MAMKLINGRIVLGTITALWCATAIASEQLCVGKLCLGMTIEEVSALPLEPAGTFKLRFDKGLGDKYGLDANGKRTWFTMGDFDKQTISQFHQKVKVVCAADFLSATMKASDGQPIRITFRPAVVNGKGAMVVSEIARQLPPNISASELKNFEDQARERYGNFFVQYWTGIGLTKPAAGVHRDPFMGTALKLALPIQIDIRKQLMEQPGCSDKVQLD